ncbi:hypothetical protein BGZ93_000115 [Podila epicladia]|nr:hypothetical protein BGZ92_000968 [Podila epicladia]KAG0086442.1 hypothetical protein BGZ93_000115 [Podila epicladia]
MPNTVRHWQDVILVSIRGRAYVLRAFALTIIVAIGLLHLSSISIRIGLFPTPPVEEPVTYMSENKDPFFNNKPADIKDLCNNLPKPRHPRGLFISHKTVDQSLKVFYWHQETWANHGRIDWAKESKNLCPISLTLQPFFDHYKTKMINNLKIQWPPGYAPCWFFTDAFNQADVAKKCDTPNNGKLDYVLSTNYTTFDEADIVMIDYPFFDSLSDYVNHAPYFDTLAMPPRLAHQKWVFWFGRESIGYYSYVGTPFYQNQFDLTMGSPSNLMDIPMPLYDITKDFALQLANTEPSFPFESKPENYVGIMVSNCEPKNNRNELIQALVDKASAHSYGSCIHTTEMPEEYKITDAGWGDWVNNKLKMLSGYPFVLAGENSSCMGYVTEKIYNAFEAGAIPIFLGAVDIADFVPEGSYVDASSFRDFDALADYIKTVDRSQFYKWKEVVKKDPSKFCKSCFKVEEEPWCSVIKKVTFV